MGKTGLKLTQKKLTGLFLTVPPLPLRTELGRSCDPFAFDVALASVRRSHRSLYSNLESTSALFLVVTVQQPTLLYSTLSGVACHPPTRCAAAQGFDLGSYRAAK